MKVSGVVFDFNGTLLWDTKEHNQAWDIFLQAHGFHLSNNEKDRIIHGRNNQLVMKDLFGPDISIDLAEAYSREKESHYRQICSDSHLGLADGAVQFLDFLRSSEIPFTIATASGEDNLDFYFSWLGLSRWFDKSAVTFNNGLIRSKPDPQIFKLAISTLGVKNAETLVFEDSFAGNTISGSVCRRASPR